jgi:hypothetical protein
MYFKNSPYDQSAFPQEAYSDMSQRFTNRTPLLPQGYTGTDLLYGTDPSLMTKIKEYLSTPWIVAIVVLLIVVVILLVSGMLTKKEYMY